MFKKLRDSLVSTLPVLVVVLVLYFTKIVSFTKNELIVFGISAAGVIVGSWLFNIGAETAMHKMGEIVGSSITKKKSIVLMVVIFFLFGVFITIAEPDLSVLASQVGLPSSILIISVGVGVGIFLVVGSLRILFQRSLKVWLLCCYGLMFSLVCLVDSVNIPLALDSGGVTTGPITVPFILALGVGIAASRGGNKSNSDSFGLIAFSSIGPILAVMIISLVMQMLGLSSTYEFKESVINSIAEPILEALLFENSSHFGTLISVAISLLPIVVFFFIYNAVSLKLNKKMLGNIIIGLIYVYIGLVIFMTAVEAGFLPIGQKIGITLAKDTSKEWLLIVVGGFLGCAAVFAEPAVHVLTNQVEIVSDGVVHKKTVFAALAIGNALAIALAITRVMFPEFDLLYVVVPGYILAFAISFAVPDIYSAIAFDSGGVVSGPMNTTFILPFTIGACSILASEKILTNAFGTVALVALMPLLSITIIGLGAQFKIRAQYKNARNRIREENDAQIIHF